MLQVVLHVNGLISMGENRERAKESVHVFLSCREVGLPTAWALVLDFSGVLSSSAGLQITLLKSGGGRTSFYAHYSYFL